MADKKEVRRAKALQATGLIKQQQTVEARIEELKAGLPHLYERKWYTWAWDFFQSRNRMTLLCAANQISKSSTQIRKCIEWSANTKLWPELWPRSIPRQFWYLYPSKDVASNEFEMKWVPEFMPRNSYKSKGMYGWKELKTKDGYIEGIEWVSGLTTFYKSYMQNVINLQSGTVHAMFCDEELPWHLFYELMFRMSAADVQGYWHMVFTATLNQPEWQRAMEGTGESELFPDALKIHASLYDCMTYRDGSPGPYTEEIIKQRIAQCPTEAEVQRRIFGRFVSTGGRKYPQFNPAKHFCKPFDVPVEWKRYAAVDIGSGGSQGHPPAISFIAVRPDYRYGVVYKCWRGDDGLDYTNSDIFLKFQKLRGSDLLVAQRFDQNAKDFGVIAQRANDPFLPSVKDHAKGEDIINTLFKNDMLAIFDTEEGRKLGGELATLTNTEHKRFAKDDLADTVRYNVVEIPWDWSVITGQLTEESIEAAKRRPLTDKERIALELEERRGIFRDEKKEPSGWDSIESEFEFWNNQYGN